MSESLNKLIDPYHEILLRVERNELLAHVTTWMDLKGIWKYKESASQVHIAYYSIYIMFLKGHSYDYGVYRYRCQGYGG